MKNFKLDTDPKIKPGFLIPDHYFESFPQTIDALLEDNNPKTISLWNKNKQWIYGLAAVIVLSICLPVMHSIKPKSNEVSDTDIENYLTYHSTLTEEDLVDLLNEDDIAKIKIDKPIQINDNDEILIESSEVSD